VAVVVASPAAAAAKRSSRARIRTSVNVFVLVPI
jgi:hypothetical protein